MNVAVLVFYICLAVYVCVLVVLRIVKTAQARKKVKKDIEQAIQIENDAVNEHETESNKD